MKWNKLALVIVCTLTLTSCSNFGEHRNHPSQASLSATEQMEPSLARIAVSEGDLAMYAPEMRRIYEQGEIRVAMVTSERFPFFYNDDADNLVGHDVDLASDIARKFGVGIRFIRTAASFDAVIDQIAAGEADIAVTKLSATLARAKKVTFSRPYMTLHQGVLVNRLKLAQLGGAQQDPIQLLRNAETRIGVIAGTSYVEFAKEWFLHATIAEYSSVADALEAVLSGDVSAIFYDELQLRQIVKDHPEHNIDLQLNMIPGRLDPIAIAISSKEPALQSWIDLYLDSHRTWIEELADFYDIRPK